MSRLISSARIQRPVLFVCDLQENFRSAIYGFSSILATTRKLLQAASALDIPVVVTTQNRTKLGQICPELELDSVYHTVANVDKTRFSMWIPEVTKALKELPQRPIDPSNDSTTKPNPADILLVGIESHICVLQTTLDALTHGHRVWVVQDGVSSCNNEERNIAFARMRQEGARVTTSESLLFEIMGDANIDAFKQIAGLVKSTKDATAESLKTLCNT